MMNHRRVFPWFAAPAALVGVATPAAAQVYLTEAQALAAVLGGQVTARRDQKSLGEAARHKLQQASGLRFPETSYTFLVAERQGKLAGYAVVLDEIGKSEPITFMVGMSPEGRVTDVAVMVFRESRGGEVKEQRFLRQFRGKTAADQIRIHQDILNYSGATLSAKALARGVRRALLLLEQFYPPAARSHPAPSGHVVLPAPPTAIAVAGEAALYRQARYRMGTLGEVRLWCRSPTEACGAFAAAFAELSRIEDIFSSYREHSELAGVNREAAHRPVEVSAEFWDLTRYGIRQWRQSAGCFDITVGPLLKAWGFRQGAPHVPEYSELIEARSRVGSDKVMLNPHGRTVRFVVPGVEMDFGGLAKGYAAERAARVARKHGALAAIVNLGGSSLYATRIHRSAEGSGGLQFAERTEIGLALGTWPVAVANPIEPGRPAFYVLLDPGWALSTSGTYEQQFEARGRTFSHLLDPRTGWPIEGLRSATAVTRTGRRGEALTKRLLISATAQMGSSASDAQRPWGKAPARCDWALLDGLPGGPLRLDRHFWRSSVLVPVQT